MAPHSGLLVKYTKQAIVQSEDQTHIDTCRLPWNVYLCFFDMFNIVKYSDADIKFSITVSRQQSLDVHFVTSHVLIAEHHSWCWSDVTVSHDRSVLGGFTGMISKKTLQQVLVKTWMNISTCVVERRTKYASCWQLQHNYARSSSMPVPVKAEWSCLCMSLVVCVWFYQTIVYICIYE